ncbi:MAG: DNA-processing protein DprA, partial [Elusimicrobia bacterium]|nr:DNA-processing protein DprA [Elusimicrobiota bacterium]
MSRPGLLDALRLNAARTSGREHPLDAEGELARLRRLGARALLRGEPDYPAEIEALEQPPLVLYALGRPAPLGLAAAVVGSRTPSRYGCRMARRLAGDLAAAGAAIVSGLARGIDAEAHEAALARGGRTWAVLGSGLARVYPPENEPLARRIADSGGL